MMHKHLKQPLVPADHVNTALSAGIGEIIDVAMAKKRDERYQSTADMLEDLKAWEAEPPKGAPKLLVVSTGSVEANKAMRLRSPVLLERDGMRVASAFGAHGTPMAVLVDAEGRIASGVAAGAPTVLALAGQEREAAAVPA